MTNVRHALKELACSSRSEFDNSLIEALAGGGEFCIQLDEPGVAGGDGALPGFRQAASGIDFRLECGGAVVGLGQRLSGQVGSFAGGFDRFLECGDVALQGGGSLDLIRDESGRSVEFPGGSVKIRQQAFFPGPLQAEHAGKDKAAAGVEKR